MTLSPVAKDYQFPKRLTIPKLKRLDAPGKLVFMAVQTEKIQMSPTQYKRVLVRGCAIYWRRERAKKKEKVERYEFSNSYDLFTWLVSKVNKRETLYLYLYDATTDFLALDGFRQLPLQDFTLQSVYHKLVTTILKFSNDSKRLVVLDVQNYYPLTLERLAQSFKVAFISEPSDTTDESAGFAWCRSKVQLIQTVIEQLIRDVVQEKKGSLRMTASSTSHSIFRASYLKHKIVTNHDPVIVEFERASYVGGYTGLHKLVVAGEPELYKVDVNSMYPSVMYDRKYPTQLLDFAENISVKQLERWLDGNSVIAKITLCARSPYYPFRQAESTYYPTGVFETTISSASLRKAMESDEIIQVHQVAVYRQEPIFADFIVDTYNSRMKARTDGNTAYELLQKSISNTLYGKFGQSQTETIRVGDAPLDEFSVMNAYDPENNTSWLEMHAGGSVLFIRRKGETRYTSFAIASHVTDYARQKLFALQEKAGKENVFYCDTDSLIVSIEGLRNLYPVISQSQIGLLKVEQVSPFFVGLAKKDYIFGDVRKLKGYSANGERVDENVFSQYQKASFTGAMSKSLSQGAWWKQVNKYYSPFIEGVKVDSRGDVRALNMQSEADRLTYKVHTLSKVRDLVRYTFNDQQKETVGEWLGMRA